MDPQRWPLPINCLDVEDKLWETKNKGGSKQKKKKERKDACPKPPFLYLPAYRMVMHLWYLRYLMYEVGFVEEDLGAACFFFFFPSFVPFWHITGWLAASTRPPHSPLLLLRAHKHHLYAQSNPIPILSLSCLSAQLAGLAVSLANAQVEVLSFANLYLILLSFYLPPFPIFG